jgi:peptidoglycan/xylan/chitin deacetylase (PgdA/CDA1 family)
MKIPILMYHQIDEPPKRGTPLRGLVVSSKSFAWQMSLLKIMGYQGLSMHHLEPYLAGEKTGKVVGITFDDGYQNNKSNALPILEANGFTATIYGVSNLIGGTNVWDRGVVAEKPLMNLDDWKTWRDAGMDIGSHTCTHAKLTDLTADAAVQEIVRSKQELQERIGCQVRHFCYPYGWHRPEHQCMVKQAGYLTATTTQRGRVSIGDNPYSLKRIMVARATNPLLFIAKIVSKYEDRKL